MTVTSDWQECAQCGKIVEGDAIYNSRQKDFEEGNLLCLCSPTCMLEYSLVSSWGEVRGNASLSEEELDEIYHDEEGGILRGILWKRIASSLDDDVYIRDFAENKDRIQQLMESGDIDEEKKKVLEKILLLIN